MPTIGFHCSHEQIPPSQLLEDVKHAEAAGFTAAMCSDHLEPWSTDQGQSGYAWSWLGAALNATNLPFGVVTAPGQRYHPAITAQAIGTLGEMFPGRFWMALGTGEASNEHITGDRWPAKDTRNRRLAECVAVIRALLEGKEVSHDGLVRVDRARIYTLPTQVPPLIGAAVSPATAEFAGSWADGLITINQRPDVLRRVLSAFDAGGGAGKPRYVQVHVSWADTDEEALTIAHDQWRSNVFSAPVCWDLELTAHFDEASRHVRPEDMHDAVLISSDPVRLCDRLVELAELGFDGVWIHHVGQRQERFIETFGEHVVPVLRTAGPKVSAAASGSAS
jgi:probable non-F420 flavinoid oxidoreductase